MQEPAGISWGCPWPGWRRRNRMSLRMRGAWTDLTNIERQGWRTPQGTYFRLRFQNSSKRLEFRKHHGEEIVTSWSPSFSQKAGQNASWWFPVSDIISEELSPFFQPLSMSPCDQGILSPYLYMRGSPEWGADIWVCHVEGCSFYPGTWTADFTKSGTTRIWAPCFIGLWFFSQIWLPR